MSMSSYEIVRRSIEFDEPERLPVRIREFETSDVQYVWWNQISGVQPGQQQSLDEWGCLWVRSEVENMGQVKEHPLYEWESIQSYKWPDASSPNCYEGMEAQFEGSEKKYVSTNLWLLLFERLWSLRGFENTLIDLALENERIEKLADRIVEYDLEIFENIHQRFPSEIHGIMFTDDWGTQQGLIIQPQLWADFFQPRYKRIFDGAHAYGWHVWMHSDGRINAILEALIEVGVDVINLQQPRLLGIEEIGQRFCGQICFDTHCDIQQTLPNKSSAAIRQEAALLIEHWAAPNGGFIVGEYGEGEPLGVPLENKRVMLEAFLEADPWSKTPQRVIKSE